MKKKRVVKGVVLTAVFILAIIVFSALTNQGNADMTADMSAPTLPTLSFERDGYELNPLVGHKGEKSILLMRDSILPCESKNITVLLQAYDADIELFEYEVYTLDGKAKLHEGSIQKIGEKISISVGDVLDEVNEAVLKLILYINKEPVYYYTRIAKENQFYVKENMDYIMELHEAISQKRETTALKKGLESNASGDNSTLQHVTIHSDMNHVLWGDLVPEITGNVDMKITEVNKSYLSANLSYQVMCAGDNNSEEIYNVREFFKVCFKNGNYYLLAYDRTATETFNANNVVLSGKGIILGMTSEKVPYKVNQDGSVVAFVVERELWCYDKNEDEFSLVFSFRDSEKQDKRNLYDQHSLRILSMEENGSMTFSVGGYMNRGMHEGESGLSIYYFNLAQNAVEEKAFIKSAQSQLAIEEELDRLAYYNAKQDILYVLVADNLYKVDLAKDTKEILAENLLEEQYVTSDEGHMIAYQSTEDTRIAEVWNFATDKRQTVKITEGEIIVPIGFVGEDFVYGIAKAQDAGHDPSGTEVLAMYKLEICNSKNQIVKTYQQKDVYILSATLQDNMITLQRATKGNSGYKGLPEDYITNNTASGGVVSLKSYWTDLKETQYRLLFESGIKNKKVNVLRPRHTLYESVLTFDVSDSKVKDYYVVYGYGKQAGRFANAGDAIKLADELSGVVVSPSLSYVWEDGNRVSWYRNFNVKRFVTKSGETSLETCIREVLEYEGKNVDVVSEINTKSPEQIIGEHVGGEGIRFGGCSAKDMCYLIDKGVPVIAMKDSKSAILLIGYDAKTLTYVDPASGSIKSSTIEKVNEMTEGSGHTFIGYVK